MMNRIHRTTRHQRRGYLYVGVMITSTIVAIVGLAAMSVARTQLRNATGGMDDELARILAQSGVELGIAQINNDPSWQTNISHGVELPAGGVSANGGTMHWQLDNGPGGNGKLLTGIGRKDDAEVRLQVGIGTGGANTVGAPLLVSGTINILAATDSLVVNAGPLRCNSTVTNNGILTADVEAQGFTNGGTHTGSTTVPGPIHDLPDSATVFDYYVSEGTLIPNSLLDDGSGGLSMSDVLLSPSSNPYGSPDPDGIYVINAQGKSLSIKWVRVVGTLVVINGGTGFNDTELAKEVNFEPAYANYPSLMVEGDLLVKITDFSLSESDRSRNYNPPGTPWQGITDTDTSDTYFSGFAGVVYCKGKLTLNGNNSNKAARFSGTVICDGNLVVEQDSQASIDHDPVPAGNPPPGFGTSSSGQITPGSWKRIASP